MRNKLMTLIVVLTSFVAVAKPVQSKKPLRRPSQAVVDSFECRNGEIRYIKMQKQESVKSAYCFNDRKDEFFSRDCISKDCTGFLKLHEHEGFDVKNYQSPQGSPAFAFCRELGGHPEIVEYLVDKKWYASDRCTFEDGYFVSSWFLFSQALKKSREESP